tara:strand:+ start:10 stop:510 length:501 start_codon:yes stop_codon:yes gene_type:complete
MPQGSCKRYHYLPLLGGTEQSCNHIQPYNDTASLTKEWYEITPLSSTTIFHRLNENTDKIDENGKKIKKPMGRLEYRDIYTPNWFTFETYYRGLPMFFRISMRAIILFVVVIALWKLLIRPLIGPSGVRIHTDNMPVNNLGENLLKNFFRLVNSLKVPKKYNIPKN